MPTLAEIKPKLPELLCRLDGAMAKLEAGLDSNRLALALTEIAKTEGAALLSQSLLGRRMPGKKLVRALGRDEQQRQRKEWDDQIRNTAQAVAAEVEGLIVSDLDDVQGRTLDKWRESLKSLRTSTSLRTDTLLRRTNAVLNEILGYVPRAPRRSGRDGNDFPPAVVRNLAHRVGYRCSNTHCTHPTAGPSDERPDAATNVGEAAHIHGALPGSRRYDSAMTPAQRRSIINGIWLCAKCARMIDRDEVTYTAERLREWKLSAEARARQAVQGERKSDQPAARAPVAYDESLSAPSPADVEEMAAVSAEIEARLEEALSETNRQRQARANLQVLAEKLRTLGRNAHLVVLPEGSENCPAAFRGLALPLLVLHVDHSVVVLDDALNGLFCYGLLAAELDGDPLPTQEGWTRIEDPARAHRVVLPLVKRLLVGSMMVAR